ncbi:MAG: ChaN family lipoprotein, partial [Verrucomicrobiales bacterium]
DVVFVGETHRLARHHRLQVVVAEKLLASGRPLRLGVEQIEARDQPVLDRYNRGEISFDAFAKAINWKSEWDNYEDYRALLETVREGKGRVIGLNAPREVIHETGKVGIAGLSKEQRALLPETIHTDDPVYERLLNQLLSVHSAFDPKFLRNVFEAQIARDDHMADTLVSALKAATPADGKTRPIALAVTGSGHIQFGLGTPDRVRWRQTKLEDRIILMSESGDLVLSPMEEEMRRAVTITHRDLRFIGRPVADYLHVKEWNPEADKAK